MSFWSAISSAAHSLLDTFERTSLAFFAGAVQAIEQAGGPLLVALAQDAVVAAENSGGSGGQKFQAAYTAVANALSQQGVPIVVNAVNIAIEAAVANLKAHSATIAAANPAGTQAPATLTPAADQNGTAAAS